MTIVYPSSIVLSAYISSAWTDISNYQIGTYSAHWGISRNGPIDFLADTGELRFTLDNTDGRFSPGSGSAFSSDWRKGCKVKLEVSYDGKTRTWYGAIDRFAFETNSVQNGNNVTVTVVDWMDKAAKYPLNYPDIVLEKTSDQIVQIVLNEMPIQPLEQKFDTGTQSFPVVFDTVSDFTKARSEFQKVLLSELCYMYLQHKNSLGERLVLENADSRLYSVAKTIPVSSDLSSFLLMETGDFLLLETGDDIILDQAQSFSSVDDAIYETSYGDNTINNIQFRYTPRVYSYYSSVLNACWSSEIAPKPNAAPSTLNYVSETSLGSNETRKVVSKYGWNNRVTAELPLGYFNQARGGIRKCFITPPFPSTIGTTDLRAWSSSDVVLGTLITSITLNSFTAYADRFEANYTNPNAQEAWMLSYLYIQPGSARIIVDQDVLTSPIQNTASIAVNDYQPLQWDMTYQINGTAGSAFANSILAIEKDPRTVLNRVNFNANKSQYWMNAFMNVDVGDLFPVTNQNRGIDSTFFVQDVKFEIAPGGIVDVSLGVRQNTTPVTVGTVVTGTASSGTTVTVMPTYQAGLSLAIIEVSLRGSESVSSVVRIHPNGGTNETFTLYGVKAFGSGSGDPRVEIWYYLSPTPGTSNITVTASGSTFLQVASIDLYNVNQSDTFGSSASDAQTSANPSVTITGNPGDLIIDVLGVATGTITPDTTQTSLWNASSDGSWRGGGSSELAGTSIPMSWTLSGSNKWAQLALVIQKA